LSNEEIKTWIKGLLTLLRKEGIKEYCLCPGKRNQQIAAALTQALGVQVTSHFDERNAGFYALGRARALGAPVAVVTTSGTAVGELLPAVMEGAYTGVPLMLLTADRPSRYRGSAAPQSCIQPGIFGVYAKTEDIEGGQLPNFAAWDRASPFHLNICLEEPPKTDFEPLNLSPAPFHFPWPKTPDIGPLKKALPRA